MKKIFSILILGLMSISLAGCDAEQELNLDDLEAISDDYYKDATSVYSYFKFDGKGTADGDGRILQKIDGADPETFEVISGCFAKDADNYYELGKVLETRGAPFFDEVRDGIHLRGKYVWDGEELFSEQNVYELAGAFEKESCYLILRDWYRYRDGDELYLLLSGNKWGTDGSGYLEDFLVVDLAKREIEWRKMEGLQELGEYAILDRASGSSLFLANGYFEAREKIWEYDFVSDEISLILDVPEDETALCNAGLGHYYLESAEKVNDEWVIETRPVEDPCLGLL